MFLEFIKSLVIPIKMKKFRYISVLFAILIFILEIFLLSLPHNFYIKSNHERYILDKAYIANYYEIGDANVYSYPLKENKTNDFQNIKDSEYHIEENKMVAKTKEDIRIYNVSYINNEEEMNLYIVFDVANNMLNKITEYQDKYLEKYPDETKNDAFYISQFIYIRSLRENIDGETLFEEYNKKTEKELDDEWATYTNFDLFNIEPTKKDSYLLLFTENYLLTQIPIIEKDEVTYASMSVEYASGATLDFREVNNIDEFGKEVCEGVLPILFNQDVNLYIINVVFYVILYPLIIVLIMWFAMHKNGVLKRFKEYYNVASIASLVPCLITFILSWFINNAIIAYI